MPATVGGYRLLRRLGGGGMGDVYEAVDPSSSRHVALKLLAPASASSTEAVERFRREGRLASAISHPRCVFVLGADEDAGRPFIVMELMSGRTLNDLVQQEGPLPAGQAVAKILDVMDGLQEAHGLGVIHRDVKPSNCFLEPDGRVKIGDFGLSRSLVGGAHLTKTGTFLGTPLFAAPEQVRLERVDQQADVYSVAATLYFLLTGQAPHQSPDAMATMARIVSDDPPPVSTLRPGIPRGLDRAVLRGLQRDRSRRWRDLEEFRRALLPFLPGRPTLASVGLRFGAYVVDSLLLWFAGFLMGWVLASLWTGHAQLPVADPQEYASNPLLQALAFVPSILGFVYFVLLESTWGASLGKRLLGLRVYRAQGEGEPGLSRILLRTFVFFGLLDLQLVLVWLGSLLGLQPTYITGAQAQRDPTLVWLALGYPMLILAIWLAGRILLVSTMRARNGYRGLHELLSGTRVVQLPTLPRRRPLSSRLPAADAVACARLPVLPERLGSYSVLGCVAGSSEEGLFLGEDSGLARRVWIRRRPALSPPLPLARREIGRLGRLRWLSGGAAENAQWDAFLAPTGCALVTLVQKEGRLGWPEARPLLIELADELAAASADQTLPATLTLEQAWVQANGRALLLDEPHGQLKDDPGSQADAERALRLLRQVAAMLLEGKARPADAAAGPIRAPLPDSAAVVMNRLMGLSAAYQTIDEAAADLDSIRDRPAEVSAGRRLWHLTLLTALLSLGLFCCMAPVSVLVTPGLDGIIKMDHDIPLHQLALTKLDQGAPADLAAGLLQPDPWVQLRAAWQWADDQQHGEQLQQTLNLLQKEREVRLQEVSMVVGWTAFWMWEADKQSGKREAELQTLSSGRHFRDLVRQAEAKRWRAGSRASLELPQLIVLLGWPLAWILWAFLLRGGLSYRMAGIALVRADGQPAWRLQCLYRALLVWAPVTALFLLSMWLDDRYWAWATWRSAAEREPHRWMLSLAMVSWWHAWGALVAFAVMALRNPTGAPNDRLAGTYLVPR